MFLLSYVGRPLLFYILLFSGCCWKCSGKWKIETHGKDGFQKTKLCSLSDNNSAINKMLKVRCSKAILKFDGDDIWSKLLIKWCEHFYNTMTLDWWEMESSSTKLPILIGWGSWGSRVDHSLEGWWWDSFRLHVSVSLGQILNHRLHTMALV